MKILFVGNFHHKILQNMVLGCEMLGWKYKHSNNVSDINDYNIIYSASTHIDADKYPDKKIIFGPQFCIIPNSTFNDKFHNTFHNSIYIQPSNWVVDFWRNETVFDAIPIKSYPYGIDTEKFKPCNNNRNNIFVYFKHRNPKTLHYVKCFLDKNNINYTIVTYGYYKEDDYIDILDKSKCGIWIGRHESQGFALLEALSMNVPLLVWNTKHMYQEYKCPKYYYNIKTQATTIPYWDNRCGEFFYDIDDFESLFYIFLKNIHKYKPREYILNNLELKTQTEKFIHLI